MRRVVQNLELWLSGLGLLVIGLVPVIMGSNSYRMWTMVAITATSVGVLHGFILWVVRQRQRQARQRTIRTIQQMLKDQINNRLTIVTLQLELLKSIDAVAELDEVQLAIQDVARLLDGISEETLQAWEAAYRTTLDQSSTLT